MGNVALILTFCAGIAVILPIALRQPHWAVLAIVLMVTISATSLVSENTGFAMASEALLAAAIGLALAYRLLFAEHQGGAARYLLMTVIWLMAVLLSILLSTAPEVSFLPLRDVAPAILLSLAVFFLVTDAKRLRFAFLGVAAGSAMVASLTVAQYALGLESQDFGGLAGGIQAHISGDTDAFRPTGPFGDPNYYGQALLPGFAVTFACFFHSGRRFGRVLAGLATVSIASAILLTSSRGALLSLLAVLFMFLWAERKLHLTAFMAIPAIVVLMLVPGYLDRILVTVDTVGDALSGRPVLESSISGRIAEMEAAALLFSNNPIHGVGYGQFETHYQKISVQNDLKARPEDRSAHSLYLEIAAEQGVIGLAAMLAILCMTTTAVSRARRKARAIGDNRSLRYVTAFALGAVGFFISSIFLHDAYPENLWLVLALMFASERAMNAHSSLHKDAPFGVRGGFDLEHA